MIIIPESGVEFGPFDQNDVFHIEKSTLYHDVQEGVKTAEFMLYRTSSAQPSILVVEAKTSAPRRDGENGSFDRYVSDVCAKFENTYELFIAMRVGRHPGFDTELASSLSAAELSKVQFRFVLVITGASEDWLAPLQDALRSAFGRHRRIWRLDPMSVVVISTDGARRYGLVASA